MNEEWPTKEQDLNTAKTIMEEYAEAHQNYSLGLFEIEVDQIEKTMNYCLSGWVMSLAKHFVLAYGAAQGDFVTRQIITRCIIQDQTLH